MLRVRSLCLTLFVLSAAPLGGQAVGASTTVEPRAALVPTDPSRRPIETSAVMMQRSAAPIGRRRAVRAAVVGAVLGGALGYVVADRLRCRAAGAPPGSVDLSCDGGDNDFRVSFAGAGALIGAGIGWLAATAREPVAARHRRARPAPSARATR